MKISGLEIFDQFEVALNAQRGVFVDRMERGEKNTVPELDGHGVRIPE